jgi:hypothetical protein
MKKNKIFLLLLILCLIFSCSSDKDNSNSYNSSDIIGIWKIIDFQENGATLDDCEMMEQREFKTDNTIKQFYFYGNNCQNSGTNDWIFTVSDNKLFTKEPNGGYNGNNDYIINYNIIELTATKLIIEGYYVDEGVDGIKAEEIPSGERFKETWERIN